jgi:hypothetical protein
MKMGLRHHNVSNKRGQIATLFKLLSNGVTAIIPVTIIIKYEIVKKKSH